MLEMSKLTNVMRDFKSLYFREFKEILGKTVNKIMKKLGKAAKDKRDNWAKKYKKTW